MPNDVLRFQDFEVLYPGLYTKQEKAALKEFIAQCKAIDERGPIDVEALISGKLPKDTPGVGTKIAVTEAMVRYTNNKYDPENPILNDAEYARRLGYQDILAYPTFGCHDDSFLHVNFPGLDTLEVSDLNHAVTSYKPVYPGDTLFLVINKWTFRDITPPEGSIYRNIASRHEGSVYNQKGEKVNDVLFRATENMKLYKEGRRPERGGGFAPVDWKMRPAHYYTDDDWEYIKNIWANEKRQGAIPLYWEDVKVGDEPTWTLDGPLEQSLGPIAPFGVGAGGSRSNIKREIMDPKIFPTLIRGEKDGIYRLPNREEQVPPVPEYTENITAAPGAIVARMLGRRPRGEGPPAMGAGPLSESEDTRSIFINYVGRDMAIRHFNNWMGDHGWLHKINWSVNEPRVHAAYGRTYFPVNPESERFLERIPKLKGKYVCSHSLSGDLAIIKSYVYDKYVRNNEYLVELVWLIEDIDGGIWTEGAATVRLPSKNAK